MVLDVLAERERAILRALVLEHTVTGEPVGSRALVDRHGLGLSSASVRAVLAVLAERGFAQKSHASSGRVPTQRGYRVYVDQLLAPEEPDAETRRQLEATTQPAESAVALARRTGQMLAERAGAAVLIARPLAEDAILAELRFVLVGPGRVVAVLRSRSGRIEHRSFDDPAHLADGDLERLHNYLGPLAAGSTLRELRDRVARGVDEARQGLGAAHAVAQRWLDSAVAHPTDDRLFVEGLDRLLRRPEFSDADKVRAYVELLESRTRLLDLLERTLATSEVVVALGDEADLPIRDVGIVAVRGGDSSERTGWLAVVGPLRIDYARVLPLVRLSARRFAQALDAAPGSCDHIPPRS